MSKGERLYVIWSSNKRPTSPSLSDLLDILDYLGMDYRVGTKHHLVVSSDKLKGSQEFPLGVVTLNTHYNNKNDTLSPAAVREFLKAAKIILGKG